MLQVEEKLRWKFVSWSEAQKSDQVFKQQRSELIKADKTVENDRKEEEKRTSGPKRSVVQKGLLKGVVVKTLHIQ